MWQGLGLFVFTVELACVGLIIAAVNGLRWIRPQEEVTEHAR